MKEAGWSLEQHEKLTRMDEGLQESRDQVEKWEAFAASVRRQNPNAGGNHYVYILPLAGLMVAAQFFWIGMAITALSLAAWVIVPMVKRKILARDFDATLQALGKFKTGEDAAGADKLLKQRFGPAAALLPAAENELAPVEEAVLRSSNHGTRLPVVHLERPGIPLRLLGIDARARQETLWSALQQVYRDEIAAYRRMLGQARVEEALAEPAIESAFAADGTPVAVNVTGFDNLRYQPLFQPLVARVQQALDQKKKVQVVAETEAARRAFMNAVGGSWSARQLADVQQLSEIEGGVLVSLFAIDPASALGQWVQAQKIAVITLINLPVERFLGALQDEIKARLITEQSA